MFETSQMLSILMGQVYSRIRPNLNWLSLIKISWDCYTLLALHETTPKKQVSFQLIHMINTRMQLLHKYRTKSLNAQKNIFEGSVLLNIVMICVILNARLHVLQWVKMGQSTIIVGHTYCLSLTLECGPNCPTPLSPTQWCPCNI